MLSRFYHGHMKSFKLVNCHDNAYVSIFFYIIITVADLVSQCFIGTHSGSFTHFIWQINFNRHKYILHIFSVSYETKMHNELKPRGWKKRWVGKCKITVSPFKCEIELNFLHCQVTTYYDNGIYATDHHHCYILWYSSNFTDYWCSHIDSKKKKNRIKYRFFFNLVKWIFVKVAHCSKQIFFTSLFLWFLRCTYSLNWCSLSFIIY